MPLVQVAETVIVEGRYDKNKLSQIIDAVILDTSGFGIFNDEEKIELFRRMAEKRGIVILTDSDGAGFQIRNFIKSRVTKGRVLHAYIPDVYGRERRKKKASSEGKLGVEGMDSEVILKALRIAGVTMDGEAKQQANGRITKSDLYTLGLSGTSGSAERRKQLLDKLGLPERMTANTLLTVLNALYTREEFISISDK
ncbi:MAG: toprim domain-containing protein [Oscillospiraceae bacterium]|jgi:ribonuclease M5